MEYDPMVEVRGRCIALEVLVYSLLCATLKAGPERFELKGFLAAGTQSLFDSRKEAKDDLERRVMEMAITRYRDMEAQVTVNFTANETKN